jgi:nucleotide-binding universal stress UspA family protein
MNPPEIIVGVDGSPASRTALRWAATDAVRRTSERVVVHVYDWRVVGARAPIGGASAADARSRAAALGESAGAAARSFAPGVNVRGEAVLGSTGPTLVSASANAGLVVVGSRGHGGFASLLLGSVSQQVATHAAGPVVVVRGRPDIAAGPIVVGVDGSQAANHALGVGFEEAVARGTSVVAIRVYTPAQPPWGADVAPHVEDWEERKAYEHQILLDDIAQWKDKYPDVAVEAVVTAGHPAEVLTGVSSTAQLVVVGTRGHGGFTGLLLGSVGLQLLHHADSPVLIARGAEATTN